MPKEHYFNVCPHCGAALDPGEHCDCGEDMEQIRRCIAELVSKVSDPRKLKTLYAHINTFFVMYC